MVSYANAVVANPVCQDVYLESWSAAHSGRPPEWLPGGSLPQPTMPSSLVVQFWMFSTDTNWKLWDFGILHVSESDKSKWLLDPSLQVDSLSLRNSEMAEDVEQNEIIGSLLSWKIIFLNERDIQLHHHYIIIFVNIIIHWAEKLIVKVCLVPTSLWRVFKYCDVELDYCIILCIPKLDQLIRHKNNLHIIV